MGPGKPGKFWNSIVALSRTGESWKMAAGPGKVWKSEITQVKNMKFMEIVRMMNTEILGVKGFM